MKSLKPTYKQHMFGSVKGRWYITTEEYYISEVGFQTKAEAVAWWKQNGKRIFGKGA